MQGDERDSIILSIGYGKDTDGQIKQRWGPINQNGGERRINVAATRARSKMTIVSSMSEGELPNDLKNLAPNFLKAFSHSLHLVAIRKLEVICQS